jgi:hypothetical protein
MRFPSACYQMETTIGCFLDPLSPAQQGWLAAWVYGTIKAKSSCQNAVIAALGDPRQWTTIRQYLREGLYDGWDRAAPCRRQLTVSLCFAPLLRWVLAWWRGTGLALAIDVTYQRDRLVVLAVCVLYRGTAIPVAWTILRSNQKGAWMPHFVRMLDLLAPAVPASMQVLVLLDRGLRSPELWRSISRRGWHPLLRLELTDTFRPATWHQRHAVRSFVEQRGSAWVGVGKAFARQPLPSTLVVVWFEAYDAPLAVLTDLAPADVGICWYGLRMWVELGFRLLKRMGWHWERTQRCDPARVERHWLVLAVATLWTVAYGTRIEDAAAQGRDPTHLLHPPATAPAPRQRRIALAALGWNRLRDHLVTGRLWHVLWLLPESWPSPSSTITLTLHVSPT